MLWDKFVYLLGSGIGSRFCIKVQPFLIPGISHCYQWPVDCSADNSENQPSSIVLLSAVYWTFSHLPLPPPSIVFLPLCLHILYLHGNCWRWWTSSLAEDILPTLASASLIHHRSDRNTYRMNWQLFSLQLHWL